MHILIIESRLTGHHPVYLEKISSGFIEAGHIVTVGVSTNDTQHPLITSLSKRYEGRFHVQPISDAAISTAMAARLGDAGREFAMRRLFAQTFVQVMAIRPVDHVFLPYLDYCLHAIALLGAPFGKALWSGICMRPSFHYAEAGVVAPRPRFAAAKERLFFRLLRDRSLKCLFTIDELLHAHAVKKSPVWQPKIQYLADPAELIGNHTKETARQALGIPEDREVILVYGAIDARKGLKELLRVFESSKLNKKTSLLIVGKQSDWAKAELMSKITKSLRMEERLFEINEFVDAHTQQMVFAASNVVWLGYKKHYAMSGVLILSVIAGLPVLSTSVGLLGWFVKKYSLGFVVDINSSISVIEGVERCEGYLNDTKERDRLIDVHSWRCVNKSISEVVL